MSLNIINNEIIGEIDHLEKKLNGEIPVTKEDLIQLVNTWGRDYNFFTMEGIYIKTCEPKECYDLSKLDISQIIDISQLFKCSGFNGNISNWNVSNVTNMSNLFDSAEKFNSPLDNWDVSNVTDMSYMFKDTKNFNQNINSWDVSKVRDFKSMFMDSISFNQPLNKWDVSNVTNISFMFYNARKFNQNINSWDISKVLNSFHLFNNAISFNKSLTNWDLTNINNVNHMFKNTMAFEKKFNNGKPLPKETNELKEWFKENMEKMVAIDIKDNEKNNLDNYYSNLNNLKIEEIK